MLIPPDDLIKSNEKWFRYDIVWKKNNGTNFLCANKMPIQSHEMIYVFSKKGANYNRIDNFVEGAKSHSRIVKSNGIYGDLKRDGNSRENYRCPKSVIEFPFIQSKLHHTCKSVELYKWFIERYSNEGDTVLDPTAGSFNSGRASVELKRNYIGMEMNDEYFEKNNLSVLQI